MSEKYYREINKTIDSLKLKMQLAGILLRINENNLNINKNKNILEDHEIIKRVINKSLQ